MSKKNETKELTVITYDIDNYCPMIRTFKVNTKKDAIAQFKKYCDEHNFHYYTTPEYLKVFDLKEEHHKYVRHLEVIKNKGAVCLRLAKAKKYKVRFANDEEEREIVVDGLQLGVMELLSEMLPDSLFNYTVLPND